MRLRFMKALITLLAVMTGLLGFAARTQNNTSLSVRVEKNMKRGYSIMISNTGKESVKVICSVEKEYDGKWREIILDASNPKPGKQARLFPIKPDQEIKINWPESSYRAFTKSRGGIFRIKVVPASITGNEFTFEPIYSEPITIRSRG